MERILIPSYDNRTADAAPHRRHYPTSAFSLGVKRLFDIFGAIVGLVVMAPVILAIWLLIVCREGAPAIFRQQRIGRLGKPFTLYKFRTMTADAESDGMARLCSENDDRLTPLGAFLRAHHLDELPQLWNVLCGHMSFVGYRPERKVFIDQISELTPDYPRLYRTRPGLFSYATLYNGYTDTMEKMLRRLRMDLDYLDNRNILVDIRIIWLTFWYIISGKRF